MKATGMLLLLALTCLGWSTPVLAKSVTLAWDTSPNPEVAGYKIYYAAGTGAAPYLGTGATQGDSPLDVGKVTTFTVSGLADTESHVFAVVAYGATGLESPASAAVTSPPLPVVPVNSPPVLAAIGSRTVAENALLSLTVAASDADGDSLSYSASGLPAGAYFDGASRTFAWRPGYDQAGTHTVTFIVSDGKATDGETVTITVTDSNRPPVISGAPSTAVTAGTPYLFVPGASDADGQSLAFTITGKPGWARFDPATGALSGTPGNGDAGIFAGIVIGVSDGQATAALPPFALEVRADGGLDSDGDGIIDSEDAFPLDPDETTDSDGDGLGNRADPDDDNDGVADGEDGYPLDGSRWHWTIRTRAGDGGYVIPAGELAVEYGRSLTIAITPKQGYRLDALVVDGQVLAPQESFAFSGVAGHHELEARFAPLASGLSPVAGDEGLAGVARLDGGSDADNLVAGSPRADLEFRFQINLRDPLEGTALRVFLVLNGYVAEMARVAGDPATGARYELVRQLGPAPRHSFHFEARDGGGATVWSYPEVGELDGPTCYLLRGKNLVGLPLDPAVAADLPGLRARGTVYTWYSEGLSTTIDDGRYFPLAAGDRLAAGQGLVIHAGTEERLPDLDALPEPAAATVAVPLQPGWNLIANPFRGEVRLADLRVERGDGVVLSWREARDSQWLVDGCYRYLGDDRGGDYQFASADNDPAAALIPWTGYWLYLAVADGDYALLVPQPRR